MTDRPWKPSKHAWRLRKRVDHLLELGESRLWKAKTPGEISWPSYYGVMEMEGASCADGSVAESLRLMHPGCPDSVELARRVLEATETWESTNDDGVRQKLVGIRCAALDRLSPGVTARIATKLLPFDLGPEAFADIVESLKRQVNRDGSVRCDPASPDDRSRRLPLALVLIFFAEFRTYCRLRAARADDERATDGADPDDRGPRDDVPAEDPELDELITRMGSLLMRWHEDTRPIGWKASGRATRTELAPTAVCLEAVMLADAVTPREARRLIRSMLKQLRRARVRSSASTFSELVGWPSKTLYHNTYYHVTRTICTALERGYISQWEGHRALFRVLRRIQTEYCSKRLARRGSASHLPTNWVTKLGQDMSAIAIARDALWSKRENRYGAWRFSPWLSEPATEISGVGATRTKQFVTRTWQAVCAVGVVVGLIAGAIAMWDKFM